ncbi:MAG: helix-turn-helix domain-containing protein [Pseudomonadota bacterium]|nr:helix-turn-helix domain-containing protein [Pseudomonadota bacterium]
MTRSPAFSPDIPIPQFALYGEAAFTHKPEFVHIESIQARSARNGWQIKPHRHLHLFQLLCVFRGGADLRVDASSASHKGCWLMTIPPGTVHGFDFRPGTDGVVLSLAVDMLGLDAENEVGSLLEALSAEVHIVHCEPRAADYRELRHYLQLLQHELDTPRACQRVALFALLKLILVTLQRRLLHATRTDAPQSSAAALTQRFRSLVENNYRRHWKVADYAARLHVSASTLNRACHDALGCTAKSVIQQRLHIEAQRRLLYTHESLDQISYALGYKDAPYFSRVFKSLEGVSPKAFRRSVSKPAANLRPASR